MVEAPGANGPRRTQLNSTGVPLQGAMDTILRLAAPTVNPPLMLTLVAGDGPLLVAVIVKVRLTPTAGVGGAEAMAMARSEEAVAVKVLTAVLLEG